MTRGTLVIRINALLKGTSTSSWFRSRDLHVTRPLPWLLDQLSFHDNDIWNCRLVYVGFTHMPVRVYMTSVIWTVHCVCQDVRRANMKWIIMNYRVPKCDVIKKQILHFIVLDIISRRSMMKNIHSLFLVGIGLPGPEIWPHEYLISPIEISVLFAWF